MYRKTKKLFAALGLDAGAVYQKISAWSLDAAARDQGLEGLRDKLRGIVPDLRQQFTGALDETEYRRYWERKMRGTHAFQVQAILDSLAHIGGQGLVLADIGDSSGNHAAYVRALADPGRVSRIVSVNLDPVAIKKIRARGFEAIHCRAEELDLEDIKPDLIMIFEMIEHLTDPLRFLHGLADRGNADHVLMTVPLRRTSRFGGAHLRLDDGDMPSKMSAEEVHIYEFSKDDWLLLARFAGFRPIFTRIYRQYPRFSPARITAPLWRRLDFEGFMAVLLERDMTLAERYVDW